MNPIDIEDIYKAQKNLKNIIKNTKLDLSLSASQKLGLDIYIKFENEQLTGSFKIRGAYNKISQLPLEVRKKGIIASSAGNHAQGVAKSCQLLNIPATIIMPKSASLVKAQATRGYGAEVIFHGDVVDDAIVYAKKKVETEGLTFVHPYEDPLIIAGQGTIGLEILNELPDLDSIFIPIGGGGLISGMAVAIKTLRPSCRVIGVVSSQAPGMFELKKGWGSSKVKPSATIADGIAIKHPSSVMFDLYISKYVDEIVSVTDDELSEAILFLMERTKTVAEGSGAAAMAAAFKVSPSVMGKKSCVLISGGNIDLNLVAKIIERGRILNGYLSELSVVVVDLPGSLNRLTGWLAQSEANIIDVRHDRLDPRFGLKQTRIDFVIETKNHEHIAAIKKDLIQEGFEVL